ncbi:MAG: Fe-S cluster assembly protein SufD [Alphaproteobacteria bacterium]|nr:Fe-S cluster assembly protein SufD [Alphaproteobacteria bacterium]MBU1513538.1 Fe-S cluster assembly protein SufD [Alphaproteobacteria bacterium]MBU2094817.1 Fe-S cluster assembly protein SufD [Alphaproteobacteria bacterium]MBU2151074.1 Fe-S cluster assembly protein SufD [Alphaproteobacteria bacterium]MBU2309357.1 Fe-S cluster assembly protein SufD [Alphaproteobacteria bacterium]
MSVASAIKTRDAAELPGKRDEDWRWTDLRGLIRQVPAPSAALDVASLPAGPFDALADELLVVANGQGAAHIGVEPGETKVVALRIVSRGDGSHAARVSVDVEVAGNLTILESYEGEGAYLGQTGLILSLAKDAVVERIILAADDAEGVTVSQAQVDLAPGASFAQTVLTGGARRQRLETIVRHPGGHADLRLDGVYLLADKRHADLTTSVTHAAVDGTTQQLTKGVVRDQARAVFQGKIIVAEGADRTDARMGHHALILSDRAEVDAKPELEIYADDVSCAHGNTVGALDEDALFYARQRGMPEAVARALLTEAFIGEVIDRIDHEGARDVVRAWAAERLGA